MAHGEQAQADGRCECQCHRRTICEGQVTGQIRSDLRTLGSRSRSRSRSMAELRIWEVKTVVIVISTRIRHGMHTKYIPTRARTGQCAVHEHTHTYICSCFPYDAQCAQTEKTGPGGRACGWCVFSGGRSSPPPCRFWKVVGAGSWQIMDAAGGVWVGERRGDSKAYGKPLIVIRKLVRELKVQGYVDDAARPEFGARSVEFITSLRTV
ncbi:hypothetical protein C8Q74DRAFT_587300 [Fomes fomentarius]|nr:hypothetical protein C8Q74DRAFT_587300 [Fomes fomentarius]